MPSRRPPTTKLDPPCSIRLGPLDPGTIEPLRWWRTRPPRSFSRSDLGRLVTAVDAAFGSGRLDGPQALLFDPAFCIARVLASPQPSMLADPGFDAAMSAILVGALHGDPACAVIIAHVLGRSGRRRTDLPLTLLAGAWRFPGPLLSGAPATDTARRS